MEMKTCLLHRKGFKAHGTLITAWLSMTPLVGRYALLLSKIKDPCGCSAICAETYCRWIKTLESFLLAFDGSMAYKLVLQTHDRGVLSILNCHGYVFVEARAEQDNC
jgi:hypothetical protein